MTMLRQNWLLIVCLVLSAVLIGDSLLLWFKKSPLPQPDQPAVKTEKVMIKPHKPLSTYALFGEGTDLTEATIQDTPLNLTLVGILRATNSADSQALISTDDAKEKLYLVNDKINTDTILWRIQKHSVLLKRHGNIEKLSLRKQALHMKKAPSSTILNEGQFE
jgi:general secretion pathway protein C